MNKVKQLTLLAACGVLSVSSAHAARDTSDDVTFKATVEQQCGIDVTNTTADLAFGSDYLESKAEVKLINNEKNSHTNLRVSNIDKDDFGNEVGKQDIYFKADGAIDKEMDAIRWQQGQRVSRQELQDNSAVVSLQARIDIDENLLDADDYELATNWVIECD
ncbi:hypothetical protein KI655_06650 [Vibrio sp. D404a]|uniref:hypothetical protein n=1 Tax=unclassified Vibrio TaxID=2614977 RepID=UPI002555948D|nr:MULTISPECIES: hypothetical protein [unclassified Vibrio]MDK9736978.1 hypothetical protein [Vibrio sp. D404a]MDK9798125.1 hypothetical protein [Vibrio sp. D449a]